MKRKLIATILIAMMALTACGSSETETESESTVSEKNENGKVYTVEFDSGTNQTVTYNDDAISFEVPESWVVSEDGIQVGNDGIMTVKGSVLNDVPDMSQEEYQEQAVELTKEGYENVTEIERKSMTIDGDIPAFYFVVTADVEDIPATIYTLSFSVDDTFYVMSYAEFDSSSTTHSKDIESVFDSVKVGE